MGNGMVNNLLKNSFDVYVFSRTKSKADEVCSNGAKWCDSVSEVQQNCSTVITILGYPEDVRSVYLGEDGLIANGKEGDIYIDMTTSDPSLAKEIYEKAKSKGISTLDAPVSGGDIGAKEARLSIMVGGDKESFDKCLDAFKAMGKNIVYQGEASSGQHTKMVNQIAISAGMLAVSEAMLYAQKAGLDPEVVLQSIEAGAAGSWTLSNLAPRMLKENFEPGFFIKHFIKDMSIAKKNSESMGLKTPGLDLTLDLYNDSSKNGYDEKGTQAIFDYIRKKSSL